MLLLLLRFVSAFLQEYLGEFLVVIGLRAVIQSVEEGVIRWFTILLAVCAEVALVDLAVTLAGKVLEVGTLGGREEPT